MKNDIYFIIIMDFNAYSLLLTNLNNSDYNIYKYHLNNYVIIKAIKRHFLRIFKNLTNKQLNQLFELLNHYIDTIPKTRYSRREMTHSLLLEYRTTDDFMVSRWYAELWQRNIFKFDDYIIEDYRDTMTDIYEDAIISEFQEWYDAIKPIYNMVIEDGYYIKNSYSNPFVGFYYKNINDDIICLSPEQIKEFSTCDSLYNICKYDKVLDFQDYYVNGILEYEKVEQSEYAKDIIKEDTIYLPCDAMKYIAKFSAIKCFKYMLLNENDLAIYYIIEYLISPEILRLCLCEKLLTLKELVLYNNEIFYQQDYDLINYLYDNTNNYLKQIVLIKAINYDNIKYLEYVETSFIAQMHGGSHITHNLLMKRSERKEEIIEISCDTVDYLYALDMIKII